MGEVALSLPADFNAIKPPQLDISLRMNLIFRKNSVSVHIQNKVCPKALSACFVNMEIKKCNILPLISFNILTKKLNKKIFVKLRSLSRQIERNINIKHLEIRHANSSHVIKPKSMLAGDLKMHPILPDDFSGQVPLSEDIGIMQCNFLEYEKNIYGIKI